MRLSRQTCQSLGSSLKGPEGSQRPLVVKSHTLINLPSNAMSDQ
jgi:hypothetical protein